MYLSVMHSVASGIVQILYFLDIKIFSLISSAKSVSASMSNARNLTNPLLYELSYDSAPDEYHPPNSTAAELPGKRRAVENITTSKYSYTTELNCGIKALRIVINL